jgi:ankyrin repeat protein
LVAVQYYFAQGSEIPMSQLIDCIFVSTNPYTVQGRGDRSPEDCFRFCMEVSLYAERAAEFGFGDHEMPKPLIHVHRATEVAYRSESLDDLEDFFNHVEWSEVTIKETIEALRVIGADDHARLLATMDDYLKSLEYTVGRSNLTRVRNAIDNAVKEHLSASVLQARYGDFGVEGDSDLDRRWRSICLQAARYMDNWTNIKRVPDGPYNQAELKKYFDSKLELARRFKETKTEGSDGWGGKDAPKDAPGVVEVQNTRAFVLASLNGDAGTVRYLLASGANVNALLSGGTGLLSDGATALMAAAAHGHIEVVKLLLAAKANVEARAKYRETALILAAREGRAEVVEALLRSKAKVNAKMAGSRTALLEASDRLHLRIVKALVAAGASVNAKPGPGPLLFACSRVYADWARREAWPVDHSARIEIVRELLAAGADVNEVTAEGMTPLSTASMDGFLEVVKELLAAGADLNAKKGLRNSALLSALVLNRADVARFLIAAKADVHAVSDGGNTTLMRAAEYGHLDFVQTFLDAGINVNAVDKRNFTALMAAARGGYMEVLNLLLAAGADVNTVTHAGTTAVFLAAMSGHLDVVKTLVAANADISVKTTRDGTTPLMIAAQKDHQEVVQFLQTLQRTLN